MSTNNEDQVAFVGVQVGASVWPEGKEDVRKPGRRRRRRT